MSSATASQVRVKSFQFPINSPYRNMKPIENLGWWFFLKRYFTVNLSCYSCYFSAQEKLFKFATMLKIAWYNQNIVLFGQFRQSDDN